MSGKRTTNTRVSGIVVKDLKVGVVYVDRLSGLLVLVLEDVTTGPHSGDPRKVTRKVVRYGWYYNAVYGTHQRMDLKDRQLVEWTGSGVGTVQ